MIMMKSIKFLFFLFLSVWMTAQNTASDFSLVDTKGRYYNLYEQLDSGKIVILDFFAHNCSSCQSNSPRLDSLWQRYGHNGDSLWIWGIECSGDTNSQVDDFDAQYGVTFPGFSTDSSVNGDSVIHLYGVVGTPTYFIICPKTRDKVEVKIDDIEKLILRCNPYLSFEKIIPKKTIDISVRDKIVHINNRQNVFFKVQLFDVSGHCLISKQVDQNKISLSLKDRPSGLYLLTVYGSAKRISKKIILP